MRWPSPPPGGLRTVIVRVLVTPPVPRQSGHFSSTMVPTPWHSRQGSEKLNAPWLLVTRPEPWQAGQGLGWLPLAAPLPPQVSHTPGVRSVRGSVVPCTASANGSVTSASTSRPRDGRRPGPLPENSELNRSEKPAPPKPRPPAPAVPGAPLAPANRSLRSNGVPPAPVPDRALRRKAP